MKNFKWLVPAGILFAGLLLTPKDSAANTDYTKKTGKKCVYCHVGTWTSQKYTEAGQYFKDHNTLKGFVPKDQPPTPAPAGQKSDKPAPKR